MGENLQSNLFHSSQIRICWHELLFFMFVYIDQTRPMDAKRRFFETQQNVPGRRRLFDHNPAYIPRDLRDPPKKSRRGRLPKPVTVKL